MELLQAKAFDELFRSFERSAFHLELQDSYHTPEEAGPFDLFLSGDPDDFAWHRPWLDQVRQAASTGRRFTRLRVVTEPHVAYTRWGLSVAPLNIEAGEDIRWLPRHLLPDVPLPTDDYWLFDDRLVVFTIFEPGGRFGGGASTVDPVIVEHCRRARDELWARAVPHDTYARSGSVGS
jgi:hypothetical protein